MMEYLLLFGMIINVFLLFRLASRSDTGLQFLLLILGIYWLLSFVIRPIMFIYSRDFGIDSVVYDSRIGQNRSDFVAVMSIIVLGCFVFCLPIIFFSLKRKFSPEYIETTNMPIHRTETIWTILFGLCSGIIALVFELSSLKNPVSKSLTPLISISLCIYLWKRRELGLSKELGIAVVLAGGLGVVVLSNLANNSKGILLTPVLFFISSLNIWRIRGLNLKKITLLLFSAVLIMPIFSRLQTIKLGKVAAAAARNNLESFPWYLSPFLEMSNRFDQFARIADAYYAKSLSLGGLDSWIGYILNSLSWNPVSGRSETIFGQSWNILVTAQSIPGSQLSKVSLTQGMIAEGYIWFGLKSLIIECLAMSILYIFIGRCLQKSAISLVFAIGLVNNATIFEAGLVQTAGIFSGVIKVILFIWVSNKIWFYNQNRNLNYF